MVVLLPELLEATAIVSAPLDDEAVLSAAENVTPPGVYGALEDVESVLRLTSIDVDWGAGAGVMPDEGPFPSVVVDGSCLEEVCSRAMRFVGGESVRLLLIVDDDAGVFEAVFCDDDILLFCVVFVS